MAICDHEEADTRLLIHLQDAILNNCTKCLVRTGHTDVVVILIGKLQDLLTLCQDVSIWLVLVQEELHKSSYEYFLRGTGFGEIPGPSCFSQFHGM